LPDVTARVAVDADLLGGPALERAVGIRVVEEVGRDRIVSAREQIAPDVVVPRRLAELPELPRFGAATMGAAPRPGHSTTSHRNGSETGLAYLRRIGGAKRWGG
jgi:hypothetical protein